MNKSQVGGSVKVGVDDIIFSDKAVRVTRPAAGNLPAIFEPVQADVDIISWLTLNREFVEATLLGHGCILFRGFLTDSIPQFKRFVEIASDTLLEYKERSSPRHAIADRIYTSTDYPAERSIFPHNEHSYSLTFPSKLFFFCLQPAQHGGETPLTDCRKVLNRISLAVRQQFARRKWMYVRNFGDGLGLSWQTAFQTEDRTAVEVYCRRSGIEYEWLPEDRLRTRQIRDAILEHPRTKEAVWFNHVAFFHVSTLEPEIRDALSAILDEAEFPNNTYYGDGLPIEADVLQEIREAYLAESVTFSWQEGDLLMIDNILAAHSRRPFSGPRQLVVALADPYTRTSS